jgi:hypothetical protein
MDLIDKIKSFVTTLEGLNSQVGQVINSLVQRNVEDYLDTLADISPEEEAKMYGRTLLQADITDNKKFRDRLNLFKDTNKEIKQTTGQPVLSLETLENPLKTALVDDSIIQLYKLANEIVLLVKDGKIDGPGLDVIVEKAVDSAVKDASMPEVKDMLSSLVDRVETVYYDTFMGELDPEIDKYITTLIDSVLSGKGTA